MDQEEQVEQAVTTEAVEQADGSPSAEDLDAVAAEQAAAAITSGDAPAEDEPVVEEVKEAEPAS